jgi:hypothetical protein
VNQVHRNTARPLELASTTTPVRRSGQHESAGALTLAVSVFLLACSRVGGTLMPMGRLAYYHRSADG